jgi:hypothetical protein
MGLAGRGARPKKRNRRLLPKRDDADAAARIASVAATHPSGSNRTTTPDMVRRRARTGRNSTVSTKPSRPELVMRFLEDLPMRAIQHL